jgi:hypothetical protein
MVHLHSYLSKPFGTIGQHSSASSAVVNQNRVVIFADRTIEVDEAIGQVGRQWKAYFGVTISSE